MKYQLADYDRGQFDRIDDLVRLCHFGLLGSLPIPLPTPGRITATTEKLSPDNVEYIESYGEELNGVCFHHSNEFDIWLNPGLLSNKLLFEITLMHELCHGYAGPIGHCRRWRRYFGRAVLLYAELLNPAFAETQPEWQVKHTIRRYRGEENPKEDYGALVYNSEIELETVVNDMESRRMRQLRRDFAQMQEMRKACHGSTSGSTPTPVYLALQQKRAGMGYPSR